MYFVVFTTIAKYWNENKILKLVIPSWLWQLVYTISVLEEPLKSREEQLLAQMASLVALKANLIASFFNAHELLWSNWCWQK